MFLWVDRFETLLTSVIVQGQIYRYLLTNDKTFRIVPHPVHLIVHNVP